MKRELPLFTGKEFQMQALAIKTASKFNDHNCNILKFSKLSSDFEADKPKGWKHLLASLCASKINTQEFEGFCVQW